MAEWTFPIDTEHNIYSNITIHQRLCDGEFKGWRFKANEGYVFYDTLIREHKVYIKDKDAFQTSSELMGLYSLFNNPEKFFARSLVTTHDGQIIGFICVVYSEPHRIAESKIDETHTGELIDPIPYSGNMTLENGKYYIQDNEIYLCNRNTEIPVYSKLSELENLYVVKM